jgi:hypothetical protein
MGSSGFWEYNGAVSEVNCALYNDVFKQGYLQRQVAVFMGNNESFEEAWAFFPDKSSQEPNRFVALSYKNSEWWTKGNLKRTAMCHPVFQPKPFMASGVDIYQHELGYTDDGASRNIFATSGYWGLDDDSNVMRVDRVYQDNTAQDSVERAKFSDPPAYNITFLREQAPNAPERPYGPVSLNTRKGYTAIRFRTRLMAFTVQQLLDVSWGLGSLLVRAKKGGRR